MVNNMHHHSIQSLCDWIESSLSSKELGGILVDDNTIADGAINIYGEHRLSPRMRSILEEFGDHPSTHTSALREALKHLKRVRETLRWLDTPHGESARAAIDRGLRSDSSSKELIAKNVLRWESNKGFIVDLLKGYNEEQQIAFFAAVATAREKKSAAKAAEAQKAKKTAQVEPLPTASAVFA